jgi:hypothetical protein
MSYNKKDVVLLTYEANLKKMNKNKDINRLSVGVAEFMMMKA